MILNSIFLSWKTSLCKQQNTLQTFVGSEKYIFQVPRGEESVGTASVRPDFFNYYDFSLLNT